MYQDNCDFVQWFCRLIVPRKTPSARFLIRRHPGFNIFENLNLFIKRGRDGDGYDAYREDRAGRANVADSPERVAYYQELARLETGALWTVANKIEPWAPRSASVPVVWRYQDLRGHVLRSAELVSPEEAGRRVIYLNNPGRRDVAAAVAGCTRACR